MKTLLITSYWLGIVADAAAALLLFSPTAAKLVLQPQPFQLKAAEQAAAVVLVY